MTKSYTNSRYLSLLDAPRRTACNVRHDKSPGGKPPLIAMCFFTNLITYALLFADNTRLQI